VSVLRSEGEARGTPLRAAGRRRLRRLAVLLSVTLLCGASYLAGIWMGARGTTCVATEPGVLVCGPDVRDVPAGTSRRGEES
jgi:hypothetical protein